MIEVPKMTEEENNIYWGKRMEQRMDEYWEIVRLVTVLKSFYYQEKEYEGDSFQYDSLSDFLENAKRPYGTKVTDDCIAFNLGWDRDRMLTRNPLPDWVREETQRLNSLVMKDLIDDGL